MTDRELIRLLRAGDGNALNIIADKYYDDIYRFCLYLTANAAESYDITQEVFLRFMKYMASYTHKNLKGYLLIIARNLCHDYFHRMKRERRICLFDSEPGIQRDGGRYAGDSSALGNHRDYADPNISENTELENAELRYLLHDVLNRLPRDQQEVIILRIGEELKFKEIAEILGCSQSTVKSRYRLAITKLRKEMTDNEN